MNEIKGLSGKVDELNKIQREERERVGNVTKNIIEKRKKNKSVNDMLLKEKSEQIAKLAMKRELLLNEKRRIMQNLEKIKSGDLANYR
jgi:hypothetical protein